MRIVLHAHSEWSYDGSWTLPALARLFGRMGAGAVLMTEHDTGFDPARFGEYRAACAAASTSACRLVPGIEYSSPDNAVHILTWGLTEFLAEGRPTQETLERVAERDGAAVFAHPARREAWRRFDPAWVPLLSGIELWNRKTDGVAPGTEARRLLAETGLPPTVGMDFHRARHFWPLDNTLEATTGADAETAAVAALRAGRLIPRAFGRPLTAEAGDRPTPGHDRAERLRRRLRDAVRGDERRR